MEDNVLFLNNVDGLGSLLGSFTKDSNNIKIILETIPSAVILVNAEGRFLYLNKRGHELYGVDFSGFDINRHVSTVNARRLDGSPFPLEEMPVSQSLKFGMAVRDVKMTIQNINGVQCPVNVCSAPLYDSDGTISGAIVIFEDYTERKQVEKELVDAKKLLVQRVEDVDITERNQAAKELFDAKERLLQNTEEKYHDLFDSIDEGFCIIEVLFDDQDKPLDYRFLEVNQAFERQMGLVDAAGRCMRELAPNHEQHWFETYGRIAITGESVRFKNPAEALGHFYDVYAFCVGKPEQRRVAILFNDITERKRAEEALRASEAQARLLAEALEKKSRLVTDFFINISHEFKTPLTILMLGLGLLENKTKSMPGGTEISGNLAAMKQNSYRLNRLIANLLDITKLDAGFMQPKWEKLDIASLLRNLANSVETYARQRQLSLDLECDAADIPFTTDSFTLERIMLNLLSNAIKHTPEGGHIRINIQAYEKGVSIAVTDTGEGIPDDKKAIIFDRFSQVDTKMTRASEGTGIGLALAKSLVELLGGHISFTSTLGAGITFTLKLPVMATTPANGISEQDGMHIDKHVQMEFSDIM